MKTLKKQRLAWLDGVRFFAAVMILLYHAQLLFYDYVFTPQPTGVRANLQPLFALIQESSSVERIGHILTLLAWFGFQFVDVFILLSGFSLVLSLRENKIFPLPFLKKRLLRLLWPYWTVAWLAYPVLWAIGVATQSYIPSAWHIFVGTTFPLVFSVRGEFLYETSGPWWFVPLIISFTLISPLLWGLLQRWGAKNLLIVSLLLTIAYRALAVYVLGGQPTYVIYDSPAGETPFQIFPAKLGIFVIGMVVAQAYQKQRGPVVWGNLQALLIGIVIYAFGFVCQFYRMGWVVADFIIPLGLTLICMVFFRVLAQLPFLEKGFTPLGKTSYTFFLIHNFVVDRTVGLFIQDDPVLYYSLLPVMVLGTLILAWIADFTQPLFKRVIGRFYRDINFLLTKPIIRRKRHWLPKAGDIVTYEGDRGWTIQEVKLLPSEKNFYICRIVKNDSAKWVDENLVHLDTSGKEVQNSVKKK